MSPTDCLSCAAPAHGAASDWWLLDASPFMLRGGCGGFAPWETATWQLSSFALCVFYTFIAGVALWIFFSARNAPFPRWPLPLIAAFFVGCGGGHLWNGLAFTWPAYHLAVLWDTYTMAVSGPGAYGVFVLARWKLRRIRALTAQRDDAIGTKDAVIASLQTAHETAQQETASLHAQLREVEHRIHNEAQVLALHARIDAVTRGLAETVRDAVAEDSADAAIRG